MYGSCFYSAQGEFLCNNVKERYTEQPYELFTQQKPVKISKTGLKKEYTFFDSKLKNCKLVNDEVQCQLEAPNRTLSEHKVVVPKTCEYCTESYTLAQYAGRDGLKPVPSISCKCGNDVYPGLLNYAEKVDSVSGKYVPRFKVVKPEEKTSDAVFHEGKDQLAACFASKGVYIADKNFVIPAKNPKTIPIKGITC
jgi:hypothetical protein